MPVCAGSSPGLWGDGCAEISVVSAGPGVSAGSSWRQNKSVSLKTEKMVRPDGWAAAVCVRSGEILSL